MHRASGTRDNFPNLAGGCRARAAAGRGCRPGRGPRGDRSDARAAAEDGDAAASQIPLDRHVCAFPKCGSEAAGPLHAHPDRTVGFET